MGREGKAPSSGKLGIKFAAYFSAAALDLVALGFVPADGNSGKEKGYSSGLFTSFDFLAVYLSRRASRADLGF